MNLFGLKPYENPFYRNPRGVEPVGRTEFNDLKNRVERLERTLDGQAGDTMRYFADSTRWHHDGDQSAPAPTWGPPWVSQTTRLLANLTSSDFAKQTWDNSLLAGASAAVVTGIPTVLGHLPWFAPLIVGGVAFGGTGAALLIHNRTLIHMAISRQGQKPKRGELRVQIDHERDGHPATDFLFLKDDIDREDLRTLARGILGGKSMAVHGWTGVGGWTRTKFDNAMAELELMGYVRPGRGNKARHLSKKGEALFRAWAE